MKLNEAFPSNTLSAADIKGHEPTVTIKTITPETFTGRDGKKQPKLRITFSSAVPPLDSDVLMALKEKAFICNITNAKRIEFMYGDELNEWIGKRITLFVDLVSFGNEVTEAIRVKPPSTRNGGSIHAPLPPQLLQPRRMSATGQHVVEPRPGYALSRMQAPVNTPVPPGQPDRDDLPEDEVPF